MNRSRQRVDQSTLIALVLGPTSAWHLGIGATRNNALMLTTVAPLSIGAKRLIKLANLYMLGQSRG